MTSKCVVHMVVLFLLFLSFTGFMVFRSQWISETDLIHGDINNVAHASLDIHNDNSHTTGFYNTWYSYSETELIDGDIIKVARAALDIHNDNSHTSTNLVFTKVETGQYRYIDAGNMMYRLDIIAYNTSNKDDELYRVVASVPLNAIPHKSTLKLISFVQQRKLMKSSFKQEHDLEKRRAGAARIREKYPDRIPVRDRTTSSHVMQYGDGTMGDETLAKYQGFGPASVDFPPDKKLKLENSDMDTISMPNSMPQCDVDLYYQWHGYKQAENGSGKKAEYLQELRKTMRHRNRMDGSMKSIAIFLFGPANASSILSDTSSSGVTDWDCYESMIRLFDEHCGPLDVYGLHHTGKLSKICDAGVSKEAMVEACNFACEDIRIS